MRGGEGRPASAIEGLIICIHALVQSCAAELECEVYSHRYLNGRKTTNIMCLFTASGLCNKTALRMYYALIKGIKYTLKIQRIFCLLFVNPGYKRYNSAAQPCTSACTYYEPFCSGRGAALASPHSVLAGGQGIQ